MNIQPITNSHQNSIKFESAFSVVCWVKDIKSGQYAPAVTSELTEKLQGQLVRAINNQKPAKNGLLNNLVSRIRKDIAAVASDYSTGSKVRSFYTKPPVEKRTAEPVAYMLTGWDARCLDDLGKKIGKEKGLARRVTGVSKSAEVLDMAKRYYLLGLDYIRRQARFLRSGDGLPLALHAKYEPIRNKQGEIIRDKDGSIKGYTLLDAGFYPFDRQNPQELYNPKNYF